MKTKLFIFFSCIILVAGLALGFVGVKRYMAEQNAGKIYDDLKTDLVIEPSTTFLPAPEEKPENPINFESLTASIVAFIAILFLIGLWGGRKKRRINPDGGWLPVYGLFIEAAIRTAGSLQYFYHFCR